MAELSALPDHDDYGWDVVTVQKALEVVVAGTW
jgi:hypothetical protein